MHVSNLSDGYQPCETYAHLTFDLKGPFDATLLAQEEKPEIHVGTKPKTHHFINIEKTYTDDC